MDGEVDHDDHGAADDLVPDPLKGAFMQDSGEATAKPRVQWNLLVQSDFFKMTGIGAVIEIFP